eukprot:Hpha_TRINITY_DN22704_c0_g1::TRINITY_DN22704_c0_g1_i1::g.34314::m.34314
MHPPSMIALLALLPAATGVPHWPEQYTSVWNQYITMDDTAVPPYKEGTPPYPYMTFQGSTFYDWPNRRMVQFMDSGAFAGLGCQYGNGQCKMINMNNGPHGGPVAFSWMTTGPNRDECCVERNVYVLPPDFVGRLTRQADTTMEVWDDKYERKVTEGVEWYATHNRTFFMGFFINKTIPGTDLQLSAMHGGHQFFNLTGWRWERYLEFLVGPPPEEVFAYPKSCLTAQPCKQQPLPHNWPTEPPKWEGATKGDLTRARTRVPGDEYRGESHRGMSDVLNAFLEKNYAKTKGCGAWSVGELRSVIDRMYAVRSQELQGVYKDAKDPRALRAASPAERWADADAELADSKDATSLGTMHRDGLCHHAVLLFVHHLTADARAGFTRENTIPLLSLTPHTPTTTKQGGATIADNYKEDVRCQLCHWNA